MTTGWHPTVLSSFARVPGGPYEFMIHLNNIHRHTNNVAPIRPARQKNNPLTI